MTKRFKIILAHILFVIGVVYLIDSNVINVTDSSGLVMFCCYLGVIIGLIFYNFIKKRNYEAKSHLIFLLIILSIVILLSFLIFGGAGMPAMRY